MLESMGSNMRWILIASLGGLLLLMALTGAASLLVFQRLEAGEAAQRARLLEHSMWMRRVENGIYLSGTLARDYFAEPDPRGLPEFIRFWEISFGRFLRRAGKSFANTFTGSVRLGARI